MRTSTQILEKFALAIARTPSLYWMTPIRPPYRVQEHSLDKSKGRDEERRR